MRTSNRTGGTEYGGYTKTPGYDFRLLEQDSLQSGGGGAGRAVFRRCHARPDEVWAGLRIRTNMGTTCPVSGAGRYWHGRGADERAGFAAGSGGRVERSRNIGNAQAAGAIGQANAWTGGAQNLAGLWNYQKNMGADRGQ